LQLARLEHFAHDVTTADEFALHIKLGNGGPIGIVLDALADFRISQHIDALVVDADIVEDLDQLARETTLRELWGALHEENDVVGLYFVVDEFVDAAHIPFLSHADSRSAAFISSLNSKLVCRFPAAMMRAMFFHRMNGHSRNNGSK